jgi:hypothetical protein
LTAILLPAAALTLVACGSDGGSEPAASSTTAPDTAPPTSSPPAVDGRTEWRDVTPEWRALAPQPFDAGPDAVAEDLAARARGGDTSTVGQIEVVAVDRGEPLVVVLRETGGDDVVQQTDIEITLQPDEAGWVLSKARARDTCYRGVDESDPTRCR